MVRFATAGNIKTQIERVYAVDLSWFHEHMFVLLVRVGVGRLV